MVAVLRLPGIGDIGGASMIFPDPTDKASLYITNGACGRGLV